MKILSISAKEILDSRRKPTVEVSIKIKKGVVKASVPSGASKGKYEALELRDKDKHVRKAVSNVNKIISKKLIGLDCTKQEKIDNLMIKLDGTKNKSKLGANAILGVSIAVARAGALAKGKELFEYLGGGRRIPTPCFNIINGGRHAKNKLSFQEYMIVPVKFKSFKQKLAAGKKVYSILKKIMTKRYGKLSLGDEGGFTSKKLSKIEEPLQLIVEAIDKAGYKGKVKIALDCAANEFYKKGKYKVDGKWISKKQLLMLYLHLIKNYPIVSIEDPFMEDAFKDYALLRKKSKIQIVGDDLLATNITRIKKAIKTKACSCLLLKPNQIGSVSEAIEAGKLAKKAGWKVMVSHRSGETTDSFIADLGVGIGTDYIKSGAPFPKERMAKYDRLVKIERTIFH